MTALNSANSESTAVPRHPLDVKPAGNAYTTNLNIKLTTGLFATVPDEVLVRILESLDAATLQQLGYSCKALYAFSRLEELWKALYVE